MVRMIPRLGRMCDTHFCANLATTSRVKRQPNGKPRFDALTWQLCAKCAAEWDSYEDTPDDLDDEGR